jgi:DNA-binding response OmpR family regulator
VLVVEDDATARGTLTRILKRLQFAVLEAATLAEALRQLERRPDWVLLDLMLPDGNGLDVLRKVLSEGIATRVCVISGCGSAVLNAARAAGAEHVFSKPLDVGRLLTVLTGTRATVGR